MAERPLLVLPTPVKGPSPKPPSKFGSGAQNPKKHRQIERLGPMFEVLRNALEERRLALQADPAGVSLEQVLVFETNGPVKDFVDAIKATPGFAWLAEEELADLDPDEDFHVLDEDKARTNKKLTARVYMVLTNQTALEQLLALWKFYASSKKRLEALNPWRPIFRCLREIRRWGVKDRLEETGILRRWQERVDSGSDWAPVEIQLWFNTEEMARAAAATRIRDLVAEAGGKVLRHAVVEEIEYHALLADLPTKFVKKILEEGPDVDLAVADGVRFFRPTPQMIPLTKMWDEGESHPGIAPPARLRSPVVALLDGLPIENHGCLRGRLQVDDPDGLGNDYPSGKRWHGTAMASLILHGDLANGEEPSVRELYVRPILAPAFGTDREMVPGDQLWVDLVHRAVRRIAEGDGQESAVAPTVRIVNFSVGDSDQPFLNSVSSIAKLIDWLAWKYQLLFVVSAGNHPSPFMIPAPSPGNEITEQDALKALYRDHRNRRLLAPAESLNALTVGACGEDQSEEWASRSSHQQTIVNTAGLPNLLSALGRGFRKAVKPDVLAPGGRAVFNRQPAQEGTNVTFEVALGPTLPGQRVASPGKRAGDINNTALVTGTSNAAALTTRLAARIVDVIEDLQQANPETLFSRIPPALVTKALVVHTASWNREAFDVLSAALKTKENANSFRDIASAFLGYGRIDPDRALACTEQRATFLSGGFIRPDAQWIHSVPIPDCLHSQACWRKLTITLAWFTPIAPRRRQYRGISLFFTPPEKSTVLRVARQDVDGKAVSRGTVQHEVLEGDSAMDIAEDAELKIPVACFTDATLREELPTAGIPYALVVSLEVAPKTGLHIYEKVRDRIQPRVRVPG
jgi:hypothetical protein